MKQKKTKERKRNEEKEKKERKTHTARWAHEPPNTYYGIHRQMDRRRRVHEKTQTDKEHCGLVSYILFFKYKENSLKGGKNKSKKRRGGEVSVWTRFTLSHGEPDGAPWVAVASGSMEPWKVVLCLWMPWSHFPFLLDTSACLGQNFGHKTGS